MPPLAVRVVLVVAFEPPAGSPIAGELTLWRERGTLAQELPFSFALQPLLRSEDGVLAIVTGVGAARAAAAIMALGRDDRFDLAQAYWLVSGVCGISPERGSLASVVLPEYVVDGDFTHEIDAREIPASWPDGFVPIGKSEPYEPPLSHRFGDDNIVYQLDARLVDWARRLAASTDLEDTPQMAARRAQFQHPGAHEPPGVWRGDELSSTTFWHGRLLSQRAHAWVHYQTAGAGSYTITAMEDAGILQALKLLAAAGRADFSRVLIVRAASNFDQQREGITAAESLAETRVASYSAYRPALENAFRVGSRIVSALLAAWPQSPA